VCGVKPAAIDAVALVFGGPHEEARRFVLDGRILAGCTPEQITETLNLRPETTQHYMDFFFDVAAELDRPGHIVSTVISGLRYGGPYERELLTLCYAGGRHVADYLLLGFDPAVPRPKSAQQVEEYLKGDIATSQTRKPA